MADPPLLLEPKPNCREGSVKGSSGRGRSWRHGAASGGRGGGASPGLGPPASGGGPGGTPQGACWCLGHCPPFVSIPPKPPGHWPRGSGPAEHLGQPMGVPGGQAARHLGESQTRAGGEQGGPQVAAPWTGGRPSVAGLGEGPADQPPRTPAELGAGRWPVLCAAQVGPGVGPT